MVNPALYDGLTALSGEHEVRLLGGLHAKLLIGTNSVLLGSMNVSQHGLEQLREAGALLTNRDTVASAATLFESW